MTENLFPAFIKLTGRRCLVVGAGPIAEAKIESLLQAHARVTVVAPRATKAIRKLSTTGKIQWGRRAFRTSDLRGIYLAVAATSSSKTNRSVFLAARAKGVLCNAVDDPPNCDFYFPAVVRRGPLQIAISTSGESPALAQHLRQELEAGLDQSFGESVSHLGSLRREILASYPPSEDRKKILHLLASREGLDSIGSSNAHSGDGTASSTGALSWTELSKPGVKL